MLLNMLKPLVLMRHRLRSLAGIMLTMVVVLVAGTVLSACESTQITTRQATALPIPVQRVLVVYERGNVDKQTALVTNEAEQKNQINLFQFFSHALEKIIPAGLQSRGIAASFVVREIDTSLPTVPVANAGFSHELRIRVIKNTQTCRDGSICANQLTVRASILAAGSAAVLWSSEIQEGPVQPLMVEQRRLDVLSNTLWTALTNVMRAAS